MEKYIIKALISLFSGIVVFLYSNSVKLSLVSFGITFLILVFFDSEKRYMRAFWRIVSFLITTNFIFFKITGTVMNTNFELSNEALNIYQSIGLLVICILLLILDFMERNKIRKLFSSSNKNTSNTVNQNHSGSGDNIAGDKIIKK